MEPQTSEDIMRVTYAGLEQYLQGLLDADAFQDYLHQKKLLFPTWSRMWQTCESWLKHHTFHSMPVTILDLARVIPNLDPFRFQLQNALHMHETFWKQVYDNLVTAKERLPC